MGLFLQEPQVYVFWYVCEALLDGYSKLLQGGRGTGVSCVGSVIT